MMNTHDFSSRLTFVFSLSCTCLTSKLQILTNQPVISSRIKKPLSLLIISPEILVEILSLFFFTFFRSLRTTLSFLSLGIYLLLLLRMSPLLSRCVLPLISPWTTPVFSLTFSRDFTLTLLLQMLTNESVFSSLDGKPLSLPFAPSAILL